MNKQTSADISAVQPALGTYRARLPCTINISSEVIKPSLVFTCAEDSLTNVVCSSPSTTPGGAVVQLKTSLDFFFNSV